MANIITEKEAYNELLWELEQDNYRFRPVDIETFVQDDYFLGQIYGQGNLYPFWMKFLKKVYPSPFRSPYEEVILSCAIGAGKSSVTSISIAYEIYKLLCLKNANEYYRLLETDSIVFMLFAATQGTAQDVNWGYISNILAISPFFKENLSFKETKAQSIELTKNIGIQIGSRAHKALGKAVLSAVLDEGNFGLIENQVRDTYNAIMRRRGSRFRDGHSVPGIVWLVSSPQTGDDFINERIKKAEGSKKVLIEDNIPIWKVRAEKTKYSGKTFWVFTGDEMQDARILDAAEDPKNFAAQSIMEVPVEHYAEFESDLLEAIRDIGGRRISSVLNIFRSYSTLIRTFKRPNLFKADTIPIQLNSTLYDLQSFVNIPLLKSLADDKTPRYLHMDYGFSGDTFGMASTMCQTREMFDSTSGQNVIVRNYINDFSVGFKAMSSDGIPTSLIVSFTKWLRDQGLNIVLVSSDKPGMNTVIPELKLLKFETEYLSVDTSRAPYMALKQKINQGEFLGVNNKVLIQEAYNLRDDGTKIDHPIKNPDGSKGSKDIADAVSGSFYSCFTHDKSGFATSSQVIDKLNQNKKDRQAVARSRRDALSNLF